MPQGSSASPDAGPPMTGLDDGRALVTAAGQGIGRAVAEALAAAGAAVVATDIAPDTYEGGTGRLEFVRLDVTDDGEVARVVGEVAPDILVNVAGIVHHGTILDCTPEEWERAVRLNARSVFMTCRAALPSMLERGEGCIVNIASLASSVRGVPARFAYGSSKAAVIGITKSIAADYVGRGIRANAICPGTVRSPSWEGRVVELAEREGIDAATARRRFEDRQPMGRVGEPDEIAAMVVYLASRQGRFMSGQEVCIDGGWSAM